MLERAWAYAVLVNSLFNIRIVVDSSIKALRFSSLAFLEQEVNKPPSIIYLHIYTYPQCRPQKNKVFLIYAEPSSSQLFDHATSELEIISY